MIASGAHTSGLCLTNPFWARSSVVKVDKGKPPYLRRRGLMTLLVALSSHQEHSDLVQRLGSPSSYEYDFGAIRPLRYCPISTPQNVKLTAFRLATQCPTALLHISGDPADYSRRCCRSARLAPITRMYSAEHAWSTRNYQLFDLRGYHAVALPVSRTPGPLPRSNIKYY